MGVQVDRVAVLHALSEAVAAYHDGLRGALDAGDVSAHWLEERAETIVADARHELANARDALAEVQEALADSMDDEDGDGDSYLVERLRECHEACAVAGNRWSRARMWQERVRLATAAFSREAEAARSLAAIRTPAIQARLDAFGRGLRGFEGLTAFSGAPGLPVVSGAAPKAPQAGGVPRPAEAPNAFGWVTRERVDFPVAAFDFADSHVRGPDDFKRVPFEVMKRGLVTFRRIVAPAVARGATGDHFSQIDRSRGVSYAAGLRAVYDAFYGSEPIKVTWDGARGRFTCEGGHHRVFAARAAGVATVPVRLTMRAEDWDAYAASRKLPVPGGGS